MSSVSPSQAIRGFHERESSLLWGEHGKSAHGPTESIAGTKRHGPREMGLWKAGAVKKHTKTTQLDYIVLLCSIQPLSFWLKTFIFWLQDGFACLQLQKPTGACMVSIVGTDFLPWGRLGIFQSTDSNGLFSGGLRLQCFLTVFCTHQRVWKMWRMCSLRWKRWFLRLELDHGWLDCGGLAEDATFLLNERRMVWRVWRFCLRFLVLPGGVIHSLVF